MKVLIFVNGDAPFSSEIEKEYKESDFVIAADGGANICYKEGIIPDYIIGDFDSVEENILEHFKEKKSIIEKYPKEKDYLDTELCLNKAIELKASEIVYIGGVGNRIDHNIGNLHLLYKTISKSINSRIISKTADIYICKDSLKISGNIGDTISIVPLYEGIEGITLKGFKYPLTDASFNFGDVFGTCNKLLETEGYINIKKGCLAVIKQKNV